MSNDTTLDALNGSSTNKATLLTEGDSTQHCPGCLCSKRRLYCDSCMKNRMFFTSNRRKKFMCAGVYTVLVALISAAISHHFYEKCDSKEEPFFLTRWFNTIVDFYSDEL